MKTKNIEAGQYWSLSSGSVVIVISKQDGTDEWVVNRVAQNGDKIKGMRVSESMFKHQLTVFEAALSALGHAKIGIIECLKFPADIYVQIDDEKNSPISKKEQ